MSPLTFFHRGHQGFSGPELSKQTLPKSPESQPFLPIEELVYVKDPSLKMNIFTLLEPGALRSSTDREKNAGSRDWKGHGGLWVLHVYFIWAWPHRRHHCVHFSVNTSHFCPE